MLLRFGPFRSGLSTWERKSQASSWWRGEGAGQESPVETEHWDLKRDQNREMISSARSFKDRWSLVL